VAAEETTEDDRSEPVAAPKSEDVAQLKDEVAALKAQSCRNCEENQAPDDKEAVARRLAAAEAAARSAAETEARQKAEEEARKKAERGSAPATEIEAKQRAEDSAAPATIGMKLPIMGAGEPAPEAPAPGMPQEACSHGQGRD